MPDAVSRSGLNLSTNPQDLACNEPENVCRTPIPPGQVSSALYGDDSWAKTTTPFLPVDHPTSGVVLHKFPATGEVSWDCVNDCVSSQGLSGAAGFNAELAMLAAKSPIGAVAVAVVEGTVTPIACYVACSDLQSIPPETPPEPVEIPDASVYSPAFP